MNTAKKNREHFAFHEIQYYLDYLNIRKEFDTGSLSAFFDHRCSNYVNTMTSDDMLARWYGFGIKWQTHGFAAAEKVRRKGILLFSKDDYFNYSIAARRSLSTRNYFATWTTDFTLRYDYYMTDYFAAYIQESAEYFISDRYGLNRSTEFGLKVLQGEVEVTPYLRHEYITDNTGELPKDKNHYGAGIRAETALYDTEPDKIHSAGSSSGKWLSPEIHLSGLYAHYIYDNIRNYRTETLFAADLIKYGETAVFFNASLLHSSLRKNAGMYPAYIDSYYEGGLSLYLFDSVFLEPLYRYKNYDEGNIIKSGNWSFQLAALRMRTAGMKPGFVNTDCKINIDKGLNLINNFEFELTGGYITEENNIHTRWTTESSLRWDICGYNTAILYLLLGEKSLKGDDLTWTIISECGVRFNRSLVMMLFYRNEINDHEKREQDLSKIYHLFGVKFDF